MSYPEYQYPSEEQLLTKWWEPDKTNPQDELDRANALVAETAAVEMRQSTWHETNLWNASLFTNRELVGFRWGTVEAHGELIPKDLRTENLIEEIGEALLAKASSSPLKPTPVPHGKSWEVEKAVRKLDWFISALWRHTKSEEACVQAFLDAYIAGLSCVRVDWDKNSKSLCCESVFFDNIIIDNRECANRQRPRHYRIRQVAPRSAVEAKYGISLGDYKTQYVDYRAVADGWVVLVEAWRLPDANGEGGRHTVACAGKLLLDDEWNHPWLPLVFFHWRDPVSGFFPRSGVELLVPYQIRLNALNDAIEESQDIACRPRLLAHTGSGIDVSQWDNEAGRILGYNGTRPEPLEWETNLNELYQERERVRSAAHAYMGLSLMTAQADMPPQVRLDSSQGVREFRNMEDARHLRLWTRFEDFRLELAKMQLLVLATGEGSQGYSVTYHPGGARGVRSKDISFKDLKTLADDSYSWTMDATPLSQLSPAVRREIIRDWASRGLLQPGEERRMEGNPNLERIEDLEMASYDDIYRHMEILEEGGYEAPGPLTNLTYGIPRVTQNFHRLHEYEDIDPVVLRNHQRWVLAATAIQVSATQPSPDQPVPFAPTQGMNGTNAALPGRAPMGMPQAQ